MEAFFCGHGLLQHAEADGAHEFAVEASGGNRDFCVVRYGVLGGSVKLVQGELPGFVEPDLFRRRHCGG